jgi:hypothetical protein
MDYDFSCEHCINFCKNNKVCDKCEAQNKFVDKYKIRTKNISDGLKRSWDRRHRIEIEKDKYIKRLENEIKDLKNKAAQQLR